MKITPREYRKDADYSYASGVFTTLELLNTRPKELIRVFLSRQGGKNRGQLEIQELCRKHGVPTEWADGLITKLSHSENCYALGVFNKYKSDLSRQTSDIRQNHVVLVNPSDMGNMGTIIRTMVGFGIKDLGVIRPGADIFDPKVIRASTGAFFRINFEYFNSFEDYQKSFPKHKIYSLMLKGAKNLSQVTFENPFGLVFGPEGSGLPESFKRLGTSIKITHSEEIDSLNLSVAVGITLYRAVGINDQANDSI